MAFFFAIAAKEVWEAVILQNGSLRGKKAATPLFATAGGMIGPITVYLGLAWFLGSDTFNAVAHGWAIPPRPTSLSAIWWGASCSAPATRRCASCCCWPSPTMPPG